MTRVPKWSVEREGGRQNKVDVKLQLNSSCVFAEKQRKDLKCQRSKLQVLNVCMCREGVRSVDGLLKI